MVFCAFVEASAQTSQLGALHAALGANRALLLERLQSDSSLQQVGRLREAVTAEADWFCGDSDDVTWTFVQECLLLLLALTGHLTDELKRFQEAPPPPEKLHTPEMAPPLPPDVLSVSQQKTLCAALQFVVSLGLCPYLAAGVGVPLGRRSAFGAVVDKLIRREASPPAGRRLLTTTSVLLQVAELSSLATPVFTRHLGDVMAALCQLGYEPHREDHRVGLNFASFLPHRPTHIPLIYFVFSPPQRSHSASMSVDHAKRPSGTSLEESTSRSSSRSC